MRNKTNKGNKNKTKKNKTKKQIFNAKTSTPFLEKIKRFFRPRHKTTSNNKYSSYSPTINRDLETLQSIPRQELSDCNIIDVRDHFFM